MESWVFHKEEIVGRARMGLDSKYWNDSFSLSIRPKKIGDAIKDFDYFQRCQQFLLFTKEGYIKEAKKREGVSKEHLSLLESESIKRMPSFEFTLLLCSLDPHGFAKDFKTSLSFFLDGEVEIDLKKNLIVLGREGKIFLIQQKDFVFINEIIKVQNGLSSLFDEADSNERVDLSNEKTRKFLEKRKLAREKVAKAKMKNRSKKNIYNLVSIMSTIKNCFVERVFEMNYLEFYEQFEIYSKKENYELGIRRLLAGDKPENVNLTHWFD